MEMIVTKEMPASLPNSAVMMQNVTNLGMSGNTVKQSEQRADSFSKKLSSALDKTASTEVNEPKSVVKAKPSDNQDKKDETTAPGLPVGLVWNLNNNMIPVPTSNAVVQGVVSEIVAQDSAPQEVEKLLEPHGQPILPAALLQGQVAKPSLQTPTMPGDFPASIEVATTTPVMTTPVMTTPVVTTSEALTKPLVMDTITNTSPPSHSSTSESSIGKSFEMISPSSAVAATLVRAEPTIKTEQSLDSTLSDFQAQKISSTSVNSEPNTLDPKLQQSVLSMQSVVTGPTAKTSEKPAADPETEAVPLENEPEPLFDLGQRAEGKIAAPTNDGQLPQKALGQTETDPFTSKADKADSAGMVLVPFDNLLKSVDQVQNPGTLAQPLRQELHEVARQVLDGMATSSDRLKSSQVIITLKPEHLGEVTVKINVDGDKVTAAFHAASSEVRAILESSLPQLRQEMSQQGWKFDSDGVFGGMKDFLANQQQQQQAQAQEQQLRHFSQRTQRDVYEDSTGFTNTGRLQVMTAAAVDYRI